MFTFLKVAESAHTEYTPYGYVVPKEKFLTKKWVSETEKVNMYSSKYFDVEAVFDPKSLSDVHQMVEKYAKTFNCLMVQNTLTPGVSGKRVRRTSANFSGIPKTEFFILDIDAIPLPEGMSNSDIEAQAKYVIKTLSHAKPRYFDEDMAFVAKGSSSAGMVDSINIHLYLRNNTPINHLQMATIAKEINDATVNTLGYKLVDESLYHSVHVLYTANPLFEPWVDDPFKDGKRIVFREAGPHAAIDPRTPEKEVSAKARLDAEDYENLRRYFGHTSLSGRAIRVLDDIRENLDDVYSKKVHNLIFEALEAGTGLKTIEEAFRKAMANHPKVLGKERSIEDYLDSGISYVWSTTKARAQRSIPDKVSIAVRPEEEIPPELRGQVITTLDVDRIPATPREGEERYLNLTTPPPEGRLTFIKASLGSGKTTFIKKLMGEGKIEGRFLAITNTKALVNGNASDFGAPLNLAYLNQNMRDEFRANPNGKMCTTIHSLHRFLDMAERGMIDFVFIDECDAVLNDLHNSPLLGENRKRCKAALRALLSTAKQVVLADGDVSEETMQGYYFLAQKPLSLVEHTYPMLEGVTAYETRSQEALWIDGVYSSLDNDQKVLVVTDLGPDPINERIRALSMAFPTKNFLGIHSKSTADEECKDVLENTNEALLRQKLHGLVCSPSVVSGVDFSYFDIVCLLTTKKTATPNLRFQALRRDRGAKELWIYTDPDCSNFHTGHFEDKYKEVIDVDEVIKSKLALRRQKEHSGFVKNLRYLLLTQGCEVIVDDETPGISLNTLVTELCGEDPKSLELGFKIDAILRADPDTVQRRYNDAWEIKQYVTHYLELGDPDKVTYADVEQYLAVDAHNKMEALAEIVDAGLWSELYYQVNSKQDFLRFLRKNAKRWYNATGQNTYTGVGKYKDYRNSDYQAARIGLILSDAEDDESPDLADYETVKHFYRLYCEFTGKPYTREFWTAEALAKQAESISDIDLQEEVKVAAEKPWWRVDE